MKQKNGTVEKQIDIDRLKHDWEELQKEQKNSLFCKRGISISHVKIVKDGKGGKVVQISLSNGGKINDIGNQHDLYCSMMPKKTVNFGRLMSLIAAVRYLGFSAVAMGLPPELKRALLQACAQCGVPLKIEKKQIKRQIAPSNSNKTASDNKNGIKVAAPAAKKVRLPFSVMTSPRSLDLAVRFQQKKNKEFLAARMIRSENEAKDEFLTLCSQAAPDICQKDESELTGEEKKIKTFFKRYASKADNIGEFISQNKDKILKRMSLDDLPENIRKKCSERQKRYKYLCYARNRALELAQVDLKKRFYQKHEPIDLSVVNLVRLSAAKLPPPDKRNLSRLSETVSDITEHLKSSRKELRKALQEKRQKVAGLLSGKGQAKEEREAKPVLKSAQRHNFIANTQIRNLLVENSLAH